MSFKLLITGRRRPGQTLRAHRRHMKDVHGALVLDYIASDPDHAPRRYVQNHAFDGWFGDGRLGADPLATARDFVTEVWFDNPKAATASRETPYYREWLRADEDRMVDQASVIGLPVNEEIVRSDAHAGRCRYKVFAMLSRAEGTAPEVFRAQWDKRVASASLERAARHARNVLLGPHAVDGIDAFWLPDADAALDFADVYSDEIIAPLKRDGVIAARGDSVVIAEEFVLHAGDRLSLASDRETA